MKHLILSVAVLFLANSAQAFYTTMDTADLVGPSKYKAGAQTQFVTSGNTGTNIIADFEYGILEDSSLKAQLGFGVTNLDIGAYYKWIPIPDMDRQPGIGVIAGVLYSRPSVYKADANGNLTWTAVNELSIRAIPIISKKFTVAFGDLTPFASLPIGMRSIDSTTDFPMQFTLGANVMVPRLDRINFLGEVGFDLSKAFSYISLGANYAF